jgi:predicted HicB family RNase H-like nuclease
MAKSKLNLTIDSELKKELASVANIEGLSISKFIEDLIYLALRTDIFNTTFVNTEKKQEKEK